MPEIYTDVMEIFKVDLACDVLLLEYINDINEYDYDTFLSDMNKYGDKGKASHHISSPDSVADALFNPSFNTEHISTGNLILLEYSALRYMRKGNHQETIPYVFKYVTHCFLKKRYFSSLLPFFEESAELYGETVIMISPVILEIADIILFKEQNVDLALQFYELYFSKGRGKRNTRLEYSYIQKVFNLEPVSKEFFWNDSGLDYLYFLFYDYASFIKTYALIDSLPFYSEDALKRTAVLWMGLYNDHFELEHDEDMKRIVAIVLHRSRQAMLTYMFSPEIETYDKESLTILLSNFHRYGLMNEEITSYLRRPYSDYTPETLYKDASAFVNVKLQAREMENLLEVKELQPDKELCYYTRYETFLHMLPKKCSNNLFTMKTEAFPNVEEIDDCGHLVLMNTKYMNDPNEGKIFCRMLFKDSESAEKLVNKDKYVFIKCFTTLVDDLSMWELYSGKSKGCCIVIDVEDIGFLNIILNRFHYVCYVSRYDDDYIVDYNVNGNIQNSSIDRINEIISWIQSVCKNHLHNSTFIGIIYDLLGNSRYMFKDSAYSHEQEIRIIEERKAFDSDIILVGSEDNPLLGLKLKKPVKIDKVILGPNLLQGNKLIPYLNSQLDILSKKNNQPEVIIEKSSIAYIGEN